MKYSIPLFALALTTARKTKHTSKKSRHVSKTTIQPDLSKFTYPAFEDKFEDLDLNKWRPEITAGGGGSWEFQFYNNDRRAAFVENKTLYIKPTLTMDYLGMKEDEFVKKGKLDLWGNNPGMQCTANGFYGCERGPGEGRIANPIMSAQLRTVNSFNFKYGRVEIEARLPKGDWIWPAIWMMPKNHAYGGWPASGEIDIVESRGNSDDCFGDGVSTVSSTLHWGNHWSKSMYELTTGKVKAPKGKDFSKKFTKFTMEWTKDYIRTWANKKLIMNVEFKQPLSKLANFTKGDFNPWANSEKREENAPFNQEFYLILNVAVGGTMGYFPEESTCRNNTTRSNKRKPWNNKSNTASAEFFKNRSQWYPSWNKGKNRHSSALAIKSVKVFTNGPSQPECNSVN
ncbi:3-glucan binding protein [Entomophthora muscae]|uniref:3-glucan binding protein n=1 Tax=Entomophthora muscae TaxID=34485 RepID=A0ACC2REH5_9FUNG|nr:3-glucan binding protein [Entomophthora muscae]